MNKFLAIWKALGGRKTALALLVQLSTLVLMACQIISDGVYATISLGVLGIYGAGNLIATKLETPKQEKVEPNDSAGGQPPDTDNP